MKLSSTAIIDVTADLGAGVVVWHHAVILPHAKLCANVSVGSGTEIGRESLIGRGSRISAHVFLPARSRIGSDVFIGPGTVFTDDRHPKANNPDYHAEPPVVEDRAAIGAGCVILPGVTIGHDSVVGAGSIVTRSIPPFSKVYGDAARLRGSSDLSLFQPVLGDEADTPD